MVGKYQAYPEYRESGNGWLEKVPVTWLNARMDDVALTIKEQVAPRDIESIQVMHYSIPTIQEIGTGREEDGATVDSNKFRVQEGDVLFSKLNPRKQTITTVRSHDQAVVASTEFIVLRSHSDNQQFLQYLLYSQELKSFVCSQVESATKSHQRINPSVVSKLKFALPSKEERLVIVNFLDHETAKIDTLIEKQQQLIQLLKEKRQAVISHAVTKGLNPNAPMRDSGVEWLGEVPEHWVITRLKYQIKMLPGYAFKSSGFVDSPEEVNLLRGINIAPGRTRWDDVVYWPRHDHVDLSEYALQENDLVLGMDRPWVGDGLRLAMISSEDLPAYVVQRVARIRGVDGISQEYLFNLLSSPSFSSYFDPITTGVSVPHISTDQIGEYCFALPSESEREDIVEFISSSISKYKKLIRGAESAIELMQERRTALISAAVTGKIDVRDFKIAHEHKDASA